MNKKTSTFLINIIFFKFFWTILVRIIVFLSTVLYIFVAPDPAVAKVILGCASFFAMLEIMVTLDQKFHCITCGAPIRRESVEDVVHYSQNEENSMNSLEQDEPEAGNIVYLQFGNIFKLNSTHGTFTFFSRPSHYC